ncbi:MAG: hypothetical protein K2Y32_20885, partial [Candidatus Obscuribacterales bacterium]|nr:hypothetical protein [Candidatus Obscuribacterales bacterium]
QGEGYDKNVTTSGTTANGGTYDRNKTVTAGQGEPATKVITTTGTTAAGKEYEKEKTYTK